MTHRNQRSGNIKKVGVVLVPIMAMIAVMTIAAAPDNLADWSESLMALSPDRPMEYFRLAETIADVARTDSERNLARHLFAIAGSLDVALLGRSASLALADMETDPLRKQRLLALASLLPARLGHATDRRSQTRSLAFGDPLGASPQIRLGGEAAYAVSEAFSLFRQGEGDRALARLERPGAMALLRDADVGIHGGTDRLLEDCRHYRNGRPPPLTSDHVENMLRLEMALLTADRRPWSSDLMLFGARPLLEVDPDNPQATLGADASRPYFRNDTWTSTP